MAKFDPKKPFTTPAASGGSKKFDPNKPFNKVVQESPDEAEEPGMLEALARGGAQGLTFGFADELTGGAQAALKAATDSQDDTWDTLLEKYRKYRDESRKNYKAAEEAHPVASLAGNVVGGLAPALLTGGAGAVAAAPSLAAKAGAGALMGLGTGLVAGAGTSDADLTKGDISGLAADTAMGGAGGLVLGAGIPVAGAALAAGGRGAGKLGKGVLNKAAEIAKDTELGQDIAHGYNKGLEGFKTYGQEAADRVTRTVNDEAQRLWDSLSRMSQRAVDRKGRKLEAAGKAGTKVDLASEIDPALQELEQMMSLADTSPQAKEAAERTLSSIVQEQPDPIKMASSRTLDDNGNLLSAIKNASTPDGATPLPGASPETLKSTLTKRTKVDPETGMPYTASVTTKVNSQIPTAPIPKGPYSPKDAATIVKRLQNKAYDQEISDPEVRSLLQRITGKLSDKVENAVPEIQDDNAIAHAALNAKGVIGSADKIGDDLKLSQEGLNFVRDFSKKLDPAIQQKKDILLNNLKNIDEAHQPGSSRYTDALTARLEDASKDFLHTKRLEGAPLVSGSIVHQLLGSMRNYTVKGANVLGKMQYQNQAATQAIKKGASRLANATQQQIQALSNHVATLPQTPATQKLQSVLNTASTRDRVGRNALLFTIEQNPEYRELLDQMMGKPEDSHE